VLRGHDREVLSLALSVDGSLLASADGTGSIRVWDVNKGESIGSLTGHSAGVSSLSFSPDGSLLASGSSDLRVWDVQRLEQESNLPTLSVPILGVAFSPVGQLVAAAGYDRQLHLLSTSSGALSSLPAEDTPLRSLAFSPDGRVLAAGDWNGNVWFWDATTQSQLSRIASAHAAAIPVLRFAPDGRLLATAGEDGTVRLWAVPEAAEDSPLEGSDAISRKPVTLFDEYHDEQDVLTMEMARERSLSNPEWFYLGDFRDAISDRYELREHASGPLTVEALEQVDILMFASPRRPLLDGEVSAVVDFVSRGGGLVVWSDAIVPTYIPNLFLRDFGIRFLTGALRSDEYVLHDRWSFWATERAEHPLTQGVDRFLLNAGLALEVEKPAMPLFTTGPLAYRDFDSDQLHDPEETGLFVVAAAVEYQGGRVVVFGDNSFTNLFLENADLLLDALEWVAGDGE
jgi:hypothetical protein